MTMPGGIVCYIMRAGAGSMIRGVRIVAAGLVREWTAPESASVSSLDSAGPSPAVAAAQAAAEFIDKTLQGVGMRRIAAVCMDADGSVCAWLSAPSPEPSIVRATIEQSALEGDATGAGVGAARLLSLSAGAPGSGSMGDVSVQALATLDLPEDDKRPARPGLSLKSLKRFGRGAQDALPGPGKSRYAVLAVPDAPVRVLIDELDARGIEVQAVLTLWHAMAAGIGASGGGDQRPGAVVIVEPEGRLIWAWTQGGDLLAGGTMRLSTFSVRQNTPETDDRSLVTAGDNGAPALNTGGPGTVGVEFSRSDAGRLAMDWLAWGAQLGRCPQRVVCLCSPNVGTPAGDGPQVLPRLLAKLWPGATIDGVVNADPIGLTLGRLAGLGPEATSASDSTGRVETGPAETRPRSALVDLSARPGRADKSLYRWAALCLVALACVVGAAGWQVYRSVGAVKERLAETVSERNKVLDELRVLVRDDNLAKMNPAAQEDRINGARKQLQDVLKLLRPPKPVLDETARLLEALDGVEGVKLTEFEINNVIARATISLPAPAANASPEQAEKARMAGPIIIERLGESPGVLAWKGEAPAFSPEGQRRYLLSAIWPERIQPVTRTPRPPKPAPAVAPEPQADPKPDVAPADGTPPTGPTPPAPQPPAPAIDAPTRTSKT